ncbi:MAG: transporter substrate-binding domain-containing protein [Acetobacteraceae bacterium]|nr:transporter substrate-binding domain-containing protein [Acetobacteraceae bacterium]
MARADVLSVLAPTGVLRAGINMSNVLLVSSRTPEGGPAGVAPDMAAGVAACLGVPVRYVPYPRPGELADDAAKDAWDIGLIGAEPQRAAQIAFTPAYAEIEATFLVPPGSPITDIAEVDAPGVRIAVAARAAYDLWLERNFRHATLLRANSLESSFALFRDGGLEALAGLRPKLAADAATMPGSRVLPGRFMAVQQAIGVPRQRPGAEAAAAFLARFVAEAKASGFVAQLIARHGVRGLSVAG